ncbi:uncharacterized protein LOC105385031 isoform X2 [Plutella xylostella]|uniref:uncharacterized protein LOC105385031 isoform X2 n=1 Tax=Plutella xylostella TaxID=51655 RepID=UPI0020323FB1|nr:uncharacterized protein LOC105385031 isoform X2 [Plutella xylostella]
MIRHRYTNLTDDKMAKVDETVKEFTTNLTKDIKRLFGGGEEQKMSESQQMEEMVEGVMQLYPEISEENARELAWVLRDNGLRLKQHLDGFLDLKDPKTRYEEYTPRPDAVKFRQQPGRDVLEANARRKLIVNQGGNQARRRAGPKHNEPVNKSGATMPPFILDPKLLHGTHHRAGAHH